jgi:hypothetical protein
LNINSSKAAIPQEGKKSIDKKHEINSSKAAIPQEGTKPIDKKHEINSSKAATPQDGKKSIDEKHIYVLVHATCIHLCIGIYCYGMTTNTGKY